MTRALVIDADAVNRLGQMADLPDNWLGTLETAPEISRVDEHQITYLIGATSSADSRLLVISKGSGFFDSLPEALRLECFQRILRAGLSEFRPGLVKMPLSWRIFHAGSLMSFQSNRQPSGISYRIYADVAPEVTNHVYIYHLSKTDNEPLARAGYDSELFVDAVLYYGDARDKLAIKAQDHPTDIGHLTVSLTETFGDSNVVLGIPFSVWRDAKLTQEQRAFFDAPFAGPLRVKGPAGVGKTLVLTMRFLCEIYSGLDKAKPVRACFLAHAEETAEHISSYLLQIDERGLIFQPEKFPLMDLEITTLHGLANRYISRDSDNLQPLSLDGSEGRKMQFEVIESIVDSFVADDWPFEFKEGCGAQFSSGIQAKASDVARRGFCYNLSDEFANVVEALGVRSIDEIAPRYMRARPSERALAKNAAEKRAVLALYRRFRQVLTELGVFSLDQFTADFLAYLNSFRWDALRKERGFDFVFADELHLFNAQERRVLGLLLRDTEPPRRVAVAYDPRQSPRNSFFPQAVSPRDTIWSEAGLETDTKPFELLDVFRYTPQILRFLDRLNEKFPATDLAEEWLLNFGRSKMDNGPVPLARLLPNQQMMAESAAKRARELVHRAGKEKGEHVAVLCLDHDRFARYRSAGIFQEDFVIVSGRDELGSIERFRRRAVLSMPEYIAGLQFNTVILIDVNANLVGELGGGPNGLHRFISAVYLGASRAKRQLELYADQSAGGFAEPIQDSIRQKLIEVHDRLSKGY